MKEPPVVRAGEPLSARVWNAMAALVRSLQIIAGPGVKLAVSSQGTIISIDRQAGVQRDHAFRCRLAGEKAVSIRPGLINGITPLVGKELLDDERTLEWATTALDPNGRGWIALEVSLGKTWEVLSARVVQVADLDTLSGQPGAVDPERSPGYAAGAPLTLTDPNVTDDRRARHPLAVLRRNADTGVLRIRQFTLHDLNHRAAVQGSADKIARHFFFAAP